MRPRALSYFIALLFVALPCSASDIELVNRGLESGRLAFTLVRGKQEDIYVLDFAVGAIAPLIATDAKEAQPAWAPSGAKLAFSSDKSGTRKLYLIDDDGSNLVQVTSGSGDDEHPDWSPDGMRLIFQTTRFGSASDIFVINGDGTEEAPLVVDKHKNITPVWSPSGNEIAFATNAYWPGWDLLVFNLDSKQPKLLTHGYRSFKDPAWSPDAATVAAAYGNGVDIDIWTVSRGTQKPKQLVWHKGRSSDPVWAVGGRYLLFTNEIHIGMRDFHVFLFDATTGTNTQITKGLGFVRDLAWTDTNSDNKRANVGRGLTERSTQ